MKKTCTQEICKNPWDFYLTKWGIKRKGILFLNTSPDNLEFPLSPRFIKINKTSNKACFRLVKEKRLKYYKNLNKIIVLSRDGKFHIEYEFNPYVIGTLERIANFKLSFTDYNSDLFLIYNFFDNLNFLVRKNLAIDMHMLKQIFLDKEYSEIDKYLDNTVVLDIGSYIGDSPIYFVIKGAKKVYAYEPHPFLYEIMVKNIKINNLSEKIKPFNYGVSNRNKKMVIEEDEYLGPSIGFGSKERKIGKKTEVILLSLQEILSRHKDVDVIKMDCEGAEFESVLSCPVSLFKKIKVIVLEYHKNPKKLVNYFEKADFFVILKRKTGKKTGLLIALHKTP